jgi:hypothetical protein
MRATPLSMAEADISSEPASMVAVLVGALSWQQEAAVSASPSVQPVLGGANTTVSAQRTPKYHQRGYLTVRSPFTADR